MRGLARRALPGPPAVPGGNILNDFPVVELTFRLSYGRDDREIAVLTWVVGSG